MTRTDPEDAPHDQPYQVLLHTPGDIDALLKDRLQFAAHYDDPHAAQAYREGVMQSLMVLELYHGISIDFSNTDE
jgi:hypothetical protein